MPETDGRYSQRENLRLKCRTECHDTYYPLGEAPQQQAQQQAAPEQQQAAGEQQASDAEQDDGPPLNGSFSVGLFVCVGSSIERSSEQDVGLFVSDACVGSLPLQETLFSLFSL